MNTSIPESRDPLWGKIIVEENHSQTPPGTQAYVLEMDMSAEAKKSRQLQAWRIRPPSSPEDALERGFLVLYDNEPAYVFLRDTSRRGDQDQDTPVAMTVSHQELDNIRQVDLTMLRDRVTGEPREGLIAYEHLQRARPNGRGNRCYTQGLSFQKPKTMTAPAATMKKDIHESLDLPMSILKVGSQCAIQALRLKSPRTLALMNEMADLYNTPRIGSDENTCYPAMQLNVAPGVELRSQAEDGSLSALGAAGKPHYDEQDSPVGLTCMFNLSKEHPDIPSEVFSVIGLHITFVLPPLSGALFSGLYLHSGSQPVYNSLRTDLRDYYRVTLICYPAKDILHNHGSLALAFGGSSSYGLDESDIQHALKLSREEKPEQLANFLKSYDKRGGGKVFRQTSEMRNSWRPAVCGEQATFVRDGFGIMERRSYIKFIVKALFQQCEYILSQSDSQLELSIDAKRFGDAFTYKDEEGNRVGIDLEVPSKEEREARHDGIVHKLDEGSAVVGVLHQPGSEEGEKGKGKIVKRVQGMNLDETEKGKLAKRKRKRNPNAFDTPGSPSVGVSRPISSEPDPSPLSVKKISRKRRKVDKPELVDILEEDESDLDDPHVAQMRQTLVRLRPVPPLDVSDVTNATLYLANRCKTQSNPFSFTSDLSLHLESLPTSFNDLERELTKLVMLWKKKNNTTSLANGISLGTSLLLRLAWWEALTKEIEESHQPTSVFYSLRSTIQGLHSSKGLTRLQKKPNPMIMWTTIFPGKQDVFKAVVDQVSYGIHDYESIDDYGGSLGKVKRTRCVEDQMMTILAKFLGDDFSLETWYQALLTRAFVDDYGPAVVMLEPVAHFLRLGLESSLAIGRNPSVSLVRAMSKVRAREMGSRFLLRRPLLSFQKLIAHNSVGHAVLFDCVSPNDVSAGSSTIELERLSLLDVTVPERPIHLQTLILLLHLCLPLINDYHHVPADPCHARFLDLVRLHGDQYLPFRDAAPSRQCILANNGPYSPDRKLTAGCIFSALVFRGITFSADFLLEGRKTYYEDLEDWKQEYEAQKESRNNPTYFCRLDAYGSPARARSPDNAEEFWKFAQTWYDNPKALTGLFTFTEVFNLVRPLKSFGPLTSFLLAADFSSAGLCQPLTDKEAGALVIDGNPGSSKGLALLGYDIRGDKAEAAIKCGQALEQVRLCLESVFTPEEKNMMGMGTILVEHSLCKLIRLGHKKEFIKLCHRYGVPTL